MRKLIICIVLFFCFVSYTNGQGNFRRIVDSTKKELNTAKGNKQIDCLNLLAEAYYDKYDDDEKDLDTACFYTEEAYNLAKKSGYKKGLGYSLLWKAMCFGGRTDHNRDNNSTEANYAETYNYANKAILVGEEIKDYRLVGDIYDMLKWLERWKGDQAKFKYNVEKAIHYYEKPFPGDLSGHLDISKCNGCKGNEGKLAWLYTLLANIIGGEKSIEAALDPMNKAIHYYEMTGSNNAIANLYAQLNQAYFRQYRYKSSEEASLKSISYYQAARNVEGEIKAMTEMCKVYEFTGEFEKGLSYGKRSIKLAEGIDRANMARISTGQAFFWMCRLYKISGDYETALNIIRRGRMYYSNPIDSVSLAHWSAEIGDVHRLLGNYDSASYYLSRFDRSENSSNNFGKLSLGNLYLDKKENDKALALVIPFASYLKSINRFMPPAATCMIIAGQAKYAQRKYNEALNYSREAQTYLKMMDGRVLMISNYKLLSDIFAKLNQTDSAYYYLNLHTILKDSLLNRQFYWRLNNYKKEAEEEKKTGMIRLLQKDNLLKEQLLQEEILRQQQKEAELALLDKSNEIKDQQLLIKDQSLKEQTLLKEKQQSQLTLSGKENKLKDQRLKQQSFVKNALLAGLFLLLLLSVFVFRTLSLKRKNEKLAIKKEQAELQQKVSELEMQALRAQMNPHFIFNCLSSINRFIFKNDNKVASDYLTRFSRLIRMVLMNSQKKLITLEDELEMLRLYLDLERLRFKDAFDYSITTTNILDAGTVFIPPLLLQPFCENAVWHGLMHKETKGHLKISISEVISDEEKVLHCTIEDDGIGREKAAALKSKSAESEKSMGLKITTERLALLNQENNFSTFYKIEDIVDENNAGPDGLARRDVEGTRVQLKIRYKESIEEFV